MKRIVVASIFATLISLSNGASAQSRNDIMAAVIWPCIHSVGTEPYDLSDDEAVMADTMVFLLYRDYFERVIDMVETAFAQQYPETKLSTIYGTGQVVCVLYHPAPRRLGP